MALCRLQHKVELAGPQQIDGFPSFKTLVRSGKKVENDPWVFGLQSFPHGLQSGYDPAVDLELKCGITPAAAWAENSKEGAFPDPPIDGL